MHAPVPEELISAYFDGEVTPEERAQVEQLLEDSTDLRQFLDETAKISALLHSFPREAAPDQLAAQVQQRIDASAVTHTPPPKPATSHRRDWIAGLVGAVITLAACVPVAYLSLQQPTGESSAKVPGLITSRHREFSAPQGTTELKQMVSVDDLPAPAAAMSTSPPLPRSAPAGVERFKVEHHDLEAANKNYWAAETSELSREKESVSVEMMNANVDGTVIVPPDPEGFLKELKEGRIMVTQIVDNNNTVAIVELTVLDIEQGTDELKLLFQKQKLPQVENELGGARQSRRSRPDDTAAKSVRRPSASKEDLVVIYVRASGDKLAGLLEKSLKENPTLYKKLETQLPIEFPGNMVANLTDQFTAKDRDAISSTVADDTKATPEQEVAAEANLTVNSFVAMNGLTIEEPELSQESLQEAQRLAQAQMKKQLSLSEAQTRKFNEAVDGPANQERKSAEPSSGEDANPTEGYSTFHVANTQRAMGRNPGQMQSATAPAADANPVMNSPTLGTNGINLFNNGIPLSSNSVQLNNSVQNNGFLPYNYQFMNRMNRAVTLRSGAARDAQMVRMLIVLKPEQTANVP